MRALHCFVCTVCLATSLQGACTGPAPDPAPTAGDAKQTRISDRLARKLAVDRYRHLFENRYRKKADGSYEGFPPLDESTFVVEEEGEALVVTSAPLRGYHVQARVSRDGAWVELVNVGYASH